MLTKRQVILKLTNGQHEADVEAKDTNGDTVLITITAHDLDRLMYDGQAHQMGNIHIFTEKGEDGFSITYREVSEC